MYRIYFISHWAAFCSNVTSKGHLSLLIKKNGVGLRQSHCVLCVELKACTLLAASLIYIHPHIDGNTAGQFAKFLGISKGISCKVSQFNLPWHFSLPPSA